VPAIDEEMYDSRAITYQDQRIVESEYISEGISSYDKAEEYENDGTNDVCKFVNLSPKWRSLHPRLNLIFRLVQTFLKFGCLLACSLLNHLSSLSQCKVPLNCSLEQLIV
jgi:hypothetical protein